MHESCECVGVGAGAVHVDNEKRERGTHAILLSGASLAACACLPTSSATESPVARFVTVQALPGPSCSMCSPRSCGENEREMFGLHSG